MNRLRRTAHAALICLLTITALAAAPAFCAGGDTPKVARNISYMAQGGDPKLNTLDVSTPVGAKSALPVIMFIHGGGWRNGDKVMGAGDKATDFTQEGYVFVSINYRLSPAVTHPVFAQDCAQAVAWVYSHIAGYGGDPKRIFLMGHSAGAHLAALISTDTHYLTDVGVPMKALRGCILLDSAAYDMRPGAPNDLIPKVLIRKAFGSDPAVLKSASPLVYVAAGHDIPPFLIFYVATRDTSRQQSETMASALTAAHAPVEVKPAYDKSHRTLNVGLGTEGDIPTEQTLEFLAKYK
jgi:arylformamidase